MTTRPHKVFGRRGAPNAADFGVRRVASTFGKEHHRTYSEKSSGIISVEHDGERLVAKLLALSPYVKAFNPQPFTVDLRSGSIHRTQGARAAARSTYDAADGPKFYTPDFLVEWSQGAPCALEVKSERGARNPDHALPLDAAKPILEAHGYQLSKVVVPQPPNPLYSNTLLLKQATFQGGHQLSADALSDIEAACEHGLPQGDVCARFEISPNFIPVLLVTGVLSADLSARYMDNSMVLTTAGGSLDHLNLLKELMA